MHSGAIAIGEKASQYRTGLSSEGRVAIEDLEPKNKVEVSGWKIAKGKLQGKFLFNGAYRILVRGRPR